MRRETKRYLRPAPALLMGALLLALIWLTYSSLSAARLPEKVGDDVTDSLQTAGRAQVVIALGAAQKPAAYDGDMAAWTSEVAALQAAALAGIDAGEFAVENQYQAVPALAGTILSEDGLAKLAANPVVVRIDLDVGGSGALGNSVPFIGADTWGPAGIDGSGVVVAVLDSGLDTDHNDLAAGLIHEACFLDSDGSINGVGLCPNGSDRQIGPGAAEDDAGHGTHVTGILGSRGNQSAPGVAPGVQFISLKVTAGPSFSGVFYYFSEVVAALDHIITVHPDVQLINMSLGTSATFPGNCDNATSWAMAGAAAINTLRANGVTAFASSGNDSSGTDMTAPACLSNVLAVGATDLADNVAFFTNSNNSTDMMAPGVNIVSSAIGNGTTNASGTSMASPHAAGCAALFLAAGIVFTPDDIEARLENSAYSVTDTTNGLSFPRIDCTLKPVTAATLSGPASGAPGVSYQFNTSVSPDSASLPVLYSYEATGMTTISHTGDLSDSISLSWPSPGFKSVEVTVHNGSVPVTALHEITIGTPATFAIPWWTVDGGGGVSTGRGYRLSGTIGQPDARTPATGGGYSVGGGFWQPSVTAAGGSHELYLPVTLK